MPKSPLSTKSWLSWRRLRVCLFALISTGLLVNTLIVVVTLHGQEEGVTHHHSLLRGGSDIQSALASLDFLHSSASSMAYPRITEEEYWNEILQYSNSSNCKLSSNNSNHTTPFHSDIRSYIQRNPNAPSGCSLPPTQPLCQETQYSVVLYHSSEFQAFDSQGDQAFRPLVIHVMALLAYPSLQDIHLIVSDDFVAKMGTNVNAKYSGRILQWKEQRNIQIHTAQSLWEAVSTVQNSISTQAVAFLDASQPKDWNGTLLKAQLHQWRRHPNQLVAHRYNPVIPKDTCQFPSLNGMMMHRNHLCVWNHPVVQRYVQQQHSSNFKSLDWNVAAAAMSLVLLQASPGYEMVSANIAIANQLSLGDLTMLEDLVKYFGCTCKHASNDHNGSKAMEKICPDSMQVESTSG
jgi:hypothetical protein